MSNFIIKNDGGLIIKGDYYSTEPCLDSSLFIDDSIVVNNSDVNSSDEFYKILTSLLGLSIIDSTPNKIIIDKKGNLVAKVIIDNTLNSIIVTNNNEIKVKYLIKGVV